MKKSKKDANEWKNEWIIEKRKERCEWIKYEWIKDRKTKKEICKWIRNEWIKEMMKTTEKEGKKERCGRMKYWMNRREERKKKKENLSELNPR